MNSSVELTVISQRIRNRMIEYLMLVSSFDAQRRYQRNAPVSVPNQVINRWEDFFDVSSAVRFAGPVYTAAEADALLEFYRVWTEVADATPDPLPELEETLRLPAWERLRSAAETTLGVLMQRGFLSEEFEEEENG